MLRAFEAGAEHGSGRKLEPTGCRSWPCATSPPSPSPGRCMVAALPEAGWPPAILEVVGVADLTKAVAFGCYRVVSWRGGGPGGGSRTLVVGGLRGSNAGRHPWPLGRHGCGCWQTGATEELKHRGTSPIQSGYCSTVTASVDAVSSLHAPSWCFYPFHLTPGENSILGSDGGAFVVMPFLEASSWSPWSCMSGAHLPR